MDSIVQTVGRRIQLMLLIGNFRLTGAFRVAWEIALGVDKGIFDVTIVALEMLHSIQERKNRTEAERRGIRTYVLQLSRRGRLRTIFDIMYILRKHEIDILHTHAHACDVYGRIAGLLAGTPVKLVTIHNMGPHRSKKTFGMVVDWILSRFTAKFVAVAYTIEEYTRRQLGLAASKITTIYNGINVEEFSVLTRSNNIRVKHNLPLTRKIIGCIGLIDSMKGQFDLLKAMRILAQTRDDFYVIFYGEGRDVDMLVNSIGRYFQSMAHVYGWCLDRTEMYSAIDYLIIPSHAEGLPLTMLEAFAARIPVIATDVGAISEFVADNVTGKLVPPGNPEALASAVTELMDNEELSNRIRQNAKCKVPSSEDMAKAYQRIYDQLFTYYNA